MSGNAQQLLRSWLEQQDDVIPELRMFLGQMIGDGDTVIEGTAQEVAPNLTGPAPDDPAAEVAAQLDALRKLTGRDQIDLTKWRDDAARNERIIEALTDKLDMLACALGACPGCWGSRDPCEACGGHGRGAPGAFLPDPECFDTYVAPVLHLMAGYASRSRAGAPPHFPDRHQKPTMEI